MSQILEKFGKHENVETSSFFFSSVSFFLSLFVSFRFRSSWVGSWLAAARVPGTSLCHRRPQSLNPVTRNPKQKTKKYEQHIFNKTCINIYIYICIENMCMYVHIYIYIYIKKICVYYYIQNSYLKPRGAFESCWADAEAIVWPLRFSRRQGERLQQVANVKSRGATGKAETKQWNKYEKDERN